ncbi:sigma-70 family RNA polymerase sigma factor [Actinomadura sp. KC06]|uniref:RNA polymerase sigma factor n=1 Tax=Actinomadura sp. KC06 TaxID=2530369 RepID=UPI001042F689|nr:sigma-70 family RNA polymerase sigma factor [Actinomadura sp. KC06]TDD36493.1 sigma-70 family RNA polymerase sigma factor [Actinomadura sp. KC06]
MSAENDWSEASDNELAAAVHAGDGNAYDELFNRWAPQMYRFFVSQLRPAWREDAQDLTEETLFEVWKSLTRQAQAPSRFGPWIRTIARRRLASYLEEATARGDREERLVEATASTTAQPSIEVMFREAEARGSWDWFVKLVRESLDSLPERYRAALLANLTAGKAGQSLAAELGIPAPQAARQLSQARKLTRDALAVTLMARRTIANPCPRFQQILVEASWRGGLLGDDLRRALVKHIAQCGTCRDLKKKVGAGWFITPAFLPILDPDLFEGIRTHLHQRQNQQQQQQRPNDPQSGPSLAKEPKPPQKQPSSGGGFLDDVWQFVGLLFGLVLIARLIFLPSMPWHDQLKRLTNPSSSQATLGIWTNMSVHVEPGAFTCRDLIACRQQYRPGTVVTLTGRRNYSEQSFRWVGCSAQTTGASCTLTLWQDTSICLVDGSLDQGVLTEFDCQAFTGLRR